MFFRHVGRGLRLALRIVLVLLVCAILLVAAAIAVLETGWGKNQLRGLIVSQANKYLTATLEIGHLGGSLFSGIELDGIRLSQNGQPLVAIDSVEVAYSIRELWQQGVVLRQLRLVHPVIVAGRGPDGRWTLASLVRRDARQPSGSGPGRPIEIRRIEIVDGHVTLTTPVQFGDAHIPSDYQDLNVVAAFTYQPVEWRLDFTQASWRGLDPDLTMKSMTGGLGNGSTGFVFRHLDIRTPRTTVVVDGRIDHTRHPTVFELHVDATRFAFQEWGGVLHGLRNIAVESSFVTDLRGPTTRLGTTLQMKSSAGAIAGRFTLDSSVPGWHGAGAVDVQRLNMAGWLNRPDRPSDITGHVTFDLDLDLGGHFPRGAYAFAGPHAEFMAYAADNVRARGTLTATDALIASFSGRAYGANVTIADGSIGLDSPVPYRFAGSIASLDLRRLPASIPVPHVDSTLTFDYDAHGQFVDGFVIGRARFAPSVFLDADIGEGTVGAIDTSATPIQYSGDGEVTSFDLAHVGRGLNVGWMQDPRYRGMVAGRFHVEASGTDRDTLALTGGGRIFGATLFGGRFHDADVTIAIERGTLQTSYDGAFDRIDPAVALDDPRFDATLTGRAGLRVTVRDFFLRSPALDDYDVDGVLDLHGSTIRRLPVTAAHVDATLRDSVADVRAVDIQAPALEGSGHGTLVFAGDGASAFAYDVRRAELSAFAPIASRHLGGVLTTTGQLTGPAGAMRVAGHASASELIAPQFSALAGDVDYDAALAAGFDAADGRVEGSVSFPSIAGVPLQQVSGSARLASRRVTFDLDVRQREGRGGTVAGGVLLQPSQQEGIVDALSVSVGREQWRLLSAGAPHIVTWRGGAIGLTPFGFAAPAGDQRITVGGTWRPQGGGELRITADHVFLDALAGAFAQPARYGGVIDGAATLGGTRADPVVAARLTVTAGRVRRFSYDRLDASLEYRDGMFDVRARVDQSPTVWLQAQGTMPLALFTHSQPPRPIDLSVTSSPISLALLEGLTDVVRNVSGTMHVDVHVGGTSAAPVATGTVDAAGAGFLVAATGATYRNGELHLALAPDRIRVDTLHLEDRSGNSLDAIGGIATRELRVASIEMNVGAKRFTVLRNELGTLAVDATLQVGGSAAAPAISGDVTIQSGTVKIDEILDRVFFAPYATTAAVATTQPAPAAAAAPTPPPAAGESPNAAAALNAIASAEATQPIDALAALNPWQRLGLAIALHVPETLRLTGENVQVSPGTPIGLGNFDLHVGGDLWLLKDPGGPLTVYGSLDSIAGSYAFQGRRFQIQPDSSINFRGDLSPELYVNVDRVISGVDTRVAITGSLRNPELRLSSTPPLPESDILSLIVFNASTADLSAAQQQELAVRAGALAAGFVTAPLISAIQGAVGLETLAVEPAGEFGTGPKVTIGEEIAPGLVARFSRQFGTNEYDEAVIEYYLSRILQIRATFSDAGSLGLRSPFVRVERAGIDLLFFFSF